MSLKIAADLWQQLCALASEQRNGRFVLDQHEGRIVKIEWWRNKDELVRVFHSCEDVRPQGLDEKRGLLYP
jgi:hypothetical protein